MLRQEQRIEPAALMVLHTWNQELEHHPHVHVLVPGGGPSPDGTRWLSTRHPKHRRRKKPYLVDNRLLSEKFREHFCAGLKRLHRKGLIAFDPPLLPGIDEPDFAEWLDRHAEQAWNVFIEPPPENSQPQQMVKYLARYLTGGPISDGRLISHTDGQVTFWARSKTKRAASAARVPPLRRGVRAPLEPAHPPQRVHQDTLRRRLLLPPPPRLSATLSPVVPTPRTRSRTAFPAARRVIRSDTYLPSLPGKDGLHRFRVPSFLAGLVQRPRHLSAVVSTSAIDLPSRSHPRPRHSDIVRNMHSLLILRGFRPANRLRVRAERRALRFRSPDNRPPVTTDHRQDIASRRIRLPGTSAKH